MQVHAEFHPARNWRQGERAAPHEQSERKAAYPLHARWGLECDHPLPYRANRSVPKTHLRSDLGSESDRAIYGNNLGVPVSISIAVGQDFPNALR